MINRCLNLELIVSKSDQFSKSTSDSDYRFLVNARKESIINNPSYIQVFQEKHGFINNLSILDLLFNEGPNALTYLKQNPISINYLL